MKALVIAEHADAARELAGGARQLGAETVEACVLGGAVPEGAADVALELDAPEGAMLDDAYLALEPRAQAADVVLAENTRRAKAVAGRLAARMGVAAAPATVALTAEGARGTYFGGVAERVLVPAGKAVYLVAAGVCDASQAKGEGAAERLEWVAPERAAKVTGEQARERTAADPTKADFVVACGRGFAEESELQLARDLAEKEGGAIACSRPLTEGVNWLPTELYVGVSGLTLSPKVYVAAGISGQMQHMVGCNRSGLVVAVNKDKNAPVFKQCDYGIVGDVKDVLPRLTAAL